MLEGILHSVNSLTNHWFDALTDGGTWMVLALLSMAKLLSI